MELGERRDRGDGVLGTISAIAGMAFRRKGVLGRS
jgi:hypothetical protein